MKTQRMIFENAGPAAWERDEAKFEQRVFLTLQIYGIRLRGVEVYDGTCTEFVSIQDYCKAIATKYGRPYVNLANFIFELKNGYYEQGKTCEEQN